MPSRGLWRRSYGCGRRFCIAWSTDTACKMGYNSAANLHQVWALALRDHGPFREGSTTLQIGLWVASDVIMGIARSKTWINVG